jgi:hypothetical protein
MVARTSSAIQVCRRAGAQVISVNVEYRTGFAKKDRFATGNTPPFFATISNTTEYIEAPAAG